MSRRVLALGAVALAVLSVLYGTSGTVGRSGHLAAGPATHSRIATAADSEFATTGHNRPQAPSLLGVVDPSEPITFALTLRMALDGAVERYLEDLYDPTSLEYRHFLTAAEFGAIFGLPLDRLHSVEDWAVSEGFEVLGSWRQRTAIRLRATADRIADVFGVRLGRFLDPATGATFHEPLNAETIPPAIGDAVVGLSGLSNRPLRSSVHQLVGRSVAAVPAGGLRPSDLARAYDIEPLYSAGLPGDGQTIALVSFDTFRPSDIETYVGEFGIDGPAVERVAVGNPLTSPGDGAVEVELDIEVIRAVAPHVRILNFEAKNGTVDHADVIDAIVQDGRADIASDSWGRCDDQDAFDSGTRQRGLRSLQAAAAAGITFFIASGDHGAFDCWSSDPADHRVTVDFPSDSPYSVAVGGTQLSIRTDGTYLSEAGWEDYLTTGGSGGGNNPIDARPSWQVGPGVDTEASNGHRQSPDVSAAAAVDSAYRIFTATSGGRGQWHQVYGTSAAAPFWAASMLLVRQLADQEGVGRLGFVNPMLYALANSPQRDAIFHDVTRGGNLRHPAGPGWDYATGLGSPDVTALAGAVVTYLRDHPSP